MKHETRNPKPSHAILLTASFVVLFMLAAPGCKEVDTVQTCPVTSEATAYGPAMCGGPRPLDILLVVDNSESMAQEQQILADALYPFIQSLTTESHTPFGWEGPTGVRLGVVAGDTGAFVDQYPAGTTITLNGTEMPCPSAPAARNAAFISAGDPFRENSYEADEAALAAACLSRVGTSGSNVQQPLGSAAAVLESTKARNAFARDYSLLLIIFVSDRDDASTTIVTPVEHPDGFTMLANFVGVPPVDLCQGSNASISECLELPEMQVPPDDTDSSAAVACTREESGTVVTQAAPALRLIGGGGYYYNEFLYSICESDWSDAFKEIETYVRDFTHGSCQHEPLPWDAAEQTSTCEATVVYDDMDTCPEGIPWVNSVQQFENETGRHYIRCTLPKITGARTCPEKGTAEYAQLKARFEDAWGWFYCETPGENYAQACWDDIDNDGDGKIDCDDDDCSECGACTEDGRSDPEKCASVCKYAVSYSPKTYVSLAHSNLSTVVIECLDQDVPDDSNCAENTAAACADGLDNNGNGSADCDSVTITDADIPEDQRHAADPGCCPIPPPTNPGDTCRILPSDIIPICGDHYEDWPDACQAAADALDCFLPEWR